MGYEDSLEGTSHGKIPAMDIAVALFRLVPSESLNSAKKTIQEADFGYD